VCVASLSSNSFPRDDKYMVYVPLPSPLPRSRTDLANGSRYSSHWAQIVSNNPSIHQTELTIPDSRHLESLLQYHSQRMAWLMRDHLHWWRRHSHKDSVLHVGNFGWKSFVGTLWATELQGQHLCLLWLSISMSLWKYSWRYKQQILLALALVSEIDGKAVLKYAP
jgi:hypothetical protein